MTNARLNEAQAGIKTDKRNINNLRNVDDTTLMAKSKEKLRGLLMKVKKRRLAGHSPWGRKESDTTE